MCDKNNIYDSKNCLDKGDHKVDKVDADYGADAACPTSLSPGGGTCRRFSRFVPRGVFGNP